MKCLLIYLKYLHAESVEFMQGIKDGPTQKIC